MPSAFYHFVHSIITRHRARSILVNEEMSFVQKALFSVEANRVQEVIACISERFETAFSIACYKLSPKILVIEFIFLKLLGRFVCFFLIKIFAYLSFPPFLLISTIIECFWEQISVLNVVVSYMKCHFILRKRKEKKEQKEWT